MEQNKDHVSTATTIHGQKQYTQYLESQIEKFSIFMLSQRKQNEALLAQSKRIQNLQTKLCILGQKDTFRQIQNYNVQCELKTMDKKLERVNILEQKINLAQIQIRNCKKAINNLSKVSYQPQNYKEQLSTWLKYDQNRHLKQYDLKSKDHQSKNKSDYYSSEPSKYNVEMEAISMENEKQNEANIALNYQDLQNLNQIQNDQLNYIHQNIQNTIKQLRESLQIKINKIDVQSLKNKESILRISQNFNDAIQGGNNIKFKRLQKQSLFAQPQRISESARQFPTTAATQSLVLMGKKEIKKLQKKLENFLEDKFESIHGRNQQEQCTEKENHKFPRIVDNRYERNENSKLKKFPPSYAVSRQIGLKHSSKGKHHSSMKKISIFDNQFLKQKSLQLSSKNRKSDIQNLSAAENSTPVNLLIDSPKSKRSRKQKKSRARKSKAKSSKRSSSKTTKKKEKLLKHVKSQYMLY